MATKRLTTRAIALLDFNTKIYFNLKYNVETSFPKVFESIRMDRNLHVLLQFNGNPVPLIHGTDAKLKRFRMLENFPSYIKNIAGDKPYSFIDEKRKKEEEISNQKGVLHILRR